MYGNNAFRLKYVYPVVLILVQTFYFVNMDLYTLEELSTLRDFIKEDDFANAWEAAAAPLHERLVTEQSFDILTDMPPVPRMILILDYLEGQILQGGFIQLFQNGYAALLLEGIETLQELKVFPEQVHLLDEALLLFSQNIDSLDKETTVSEFAKLYQQFPQFQPLEKQFEDTLPALKQALLQMLLLP